MSEKQRCNTCKVTLNIDDFKLRRNGSRQKGCNICLERIKMWRGSKCSHGKRKDHCLICSDCGHGKIKHNCPICSDCGHGKLKHHCPICSDCGHGKLKHNCLICSDCGHGKLKHNCLICSDCGHGKLKHNCKRCGKAIYKTFLNMTSNTKQSDKKHNRYNEEEHITIPFLYSLLEKMNENPTCYYCSCDMQFVEYREDLITIERLDNTNGHIKSNCVFACRFCNLTRVGSR